MELREQKVLLSKLPKFVNAAKSNKNDILELKLACEFNSAKRDEFESRIVSVQSKVSSISQSQNNISFEEIASPKKDNAHREQRSRLNNVEVKSVPMRNSKYLFSVTENISIAIGYSFPQTQINYIARLPTHNSKSKSISFINRYIKEECVAEARAKKRLLAHDIAFAGYDNQVYINDHQISETKKLLTRVNELAKTKNYRYVWVKYCKIHIRKNDTSPTHMYNFEGR